MSTLRRARGAALLAVLIAVAVLTGCTSDAEPDDPDESGAPVVQLGAPGEDNTTLSPEEAEAIEGPGYTDADVAFVRGMIPHHRQALEMTALVSARARDADVSVMAERIEVSQVDEIGQLEGWLTDRGEELPGEHGQHEGHGEPMPGMLTVAEMDQLSAARGTRFDRLFLQYMIRHHEGAVLMVEQLLTSGRGGQEPHVFQLAQHIASDQRVEIARMKRILFRITS
jgi:uncharacterized protein (DUF305 family)